MPKPFHLAIPVDNLDRCNLFYSDILECEAGRSSDHWTDYNLFGHQLVLHVDPHHNPKKHHNEVDGKSVPVPHFGVVLGWKEFTSFAQQLTGDVVVKLYKGMAQVIQRRSPNSLYSEEFATFGADDVYDQKHAEGFIRLFSLSSRITALSQKDQEK